MRLFGRGGTTELKDRRHSRRRGGRTGRPIKNRPQAASLPYIPLLLIVSMAGCKMPGENQDFGAIEEEFVYGSLALSPVSATSAGYHEHKGKRLDEMLDDFSPSGIAEQRAFYRGFHDRLEIVKPESLNSE